MRKFFVQNFGCRATQAEGAALETMLARVGFQAAEDARGADVVILNTCTVTAQADQDVRQTVRRVHRENPGARIVVTGCYAQRAPEELVGLAGVALVVGNSHKMAIPEMVWRQEEGEGHAPYHGQIVVGDIRAEKEMILGAVEEAAEDRTRPNLKIQDGCNNVCTFCIIPSVRGRSRSAPAEAVVEQVRALAGRYREIVLSGINLGRWGRDLPERMRLVGLLRRILAETEVERLRISSVEPMDLSDELLELMAGEPRIAAHVHAPLQSGCDAVLKRMKRRYRARHYEERIRKARRLMPDAAIGADVMVGFPGETEEEFRESKEFIESLPFTYLHVFTYSERPGTVAAELGSAPATAVRKERNRILREVGTAKNLAFRRGMVGKRLSAVTLEEGGLALSSNYLKIELATRQAANRMVEVEIGAVTAEGLREASALRVLGQGSSQQQLRFAPQEPMVG